MYRYPADSKTLQTQAWTTIHSKTVNDHRWMKKKSTNPVLHKVLEEKLKKVNYIHKNTGNRYSYASKIQRSKTHAHIHTHRHTPPQHHQQQKQQHNNNNKWNK